VRILPILMISSMVTGLCAGSLPADFKFKPADDNKRTSFISQFKEYQEDKEEAMHPTQGQMLFKHDSSQLIEAHDTIEDDKKVQVDFIGKCRKLIAQVFAYFTDGR